LPSKERDVVRKTAIKMVKKGMTQVKVVAVFRVRTSRVKIGLKNTGKKITKT
jgi:hypothetical protein